MRSRTGGLAARWERWLDRQDHAEFLASTTVSAWLATSALAMAIAAAGAFVPVARELFQVRFLPALLSYLPALVTGIGVGLAHRGRERVREGAWPIVLVNNACLEFWCLSMLDWSVLPGGALFAAMYLFTAGWHGHLHRYTLAEPFGAVGSVLALLAAAAFAPSADRIVVLAMLGVAGLVAMFLTGAYAVQRDRAHAQVAELRAAVQAQMLEEQGREVGRLARTLTEVLGYNHDVNNAIQAARLTVDLMRVRASLPQPLTQEQVRDLGEDLSRSIDRVVGLIFEARRIGRDGIVVPAEPVELAPVVHEIAGAVARRYPKVRFEVAPASSVIHARVRGGRPALQRVLENLVINACEGDGTRGAARVEVVTSMDPSGGGLVIAVRDDGPGFPPARLAQPIEGFQTTKSGGTGLGLYTSERLVGASGGRLVRENRPDGGAVVKIVLPLEEA